MGPVGSNWDTEGAAGKKNALRAAMQAVEGEVQAHEAAFGQALRDIQVLMRAYVHQNTLELESGGNIRIEDGTPALTWCAPRHVVPGPTSSTLVLGTAG